MSRAKPHFLKWVPRLHDLLLFSDFSLPLGQNHFSPLFEVSSYFYRTVPSKRTDLASELDETILFLDFGGVSDSGSVVGPTCLNCAQARWTVTPALVSSTRNHYFLNPQKLSVYIGVGSSCLQLHWPCHQNLTPRKVVVSSTRGACFQNIAFHLHQTTTF